MGVIHVFVVILIYISTGIYVYELTNKKVWLATILSCIKPCCIFEVSMFQMYDVLYSLFEIQWTVLLVASSVCRMLNFITKQGASSAQTLGVIGEWCYEWDVKGWTLPRDLVNNGGIVFLHVLSGTCRQEGWHQHLKISWKPIIPSSPPLPIYQACC